jgi:hypothetical protein
MIYNDIISSINHSFTVLAEGCSRNSHNHKKSGRK